VQALRAGFTALLPARQSIILIMRVYPTLEEFLASDSVTFAETGMQFFERGAPSGSTLFF